MPFKNPEGHNWGPPNYDGLGIGYILFAVIYTVLFYLACGFVWIHRRDPAMKMRKIGLALLSVLLLHVYLFIILMVYPWNGLFPCSAEYWIMSIYLPIGIGLFQAQNQQLLIVSREQNSLIHADKYKPLFRGQGKGLGGPKYWFWRFKLWYKGASAQGKLEAFVLMGMVLQFTVSLILYCISRKFNPSGVVSRPVSPGLCRRGWEWFPSILWQLLWNYLFGPYLLWKIRMIRDIYHWRLQTTLAIIAGLPGTPLWLIGVYTDSFQNVNKYWVPAMWFAPGIITMELTTVIFPIMQIFRKKKAARKARKALGINGANKLDPVETARSSLAIFPDSKKGKMFSMESLEKCLESKNTDSLQIYAGAIELNSENIIFLTDVGKFREQWSSDFSRTFSPYNTKLRMFRAALSIYIRLVHTATANYPINIEGHIYNKLDAIFGPATLLFASARRGSDASSAMSVVTPWESATPAETPDPSANASANEFPMHEISRPASARNGSTEHLSLVDSDKDPLANISIPTEFTEKIFDDAYNSIKFMVWSETWQRYMTWSRTSARSSKA